jgi:hypothetical protein
MFIWTIQDIVGLVLLAGAALYFLGAFIVYKVKKLFNAKR